MRIVDHLVARQGVPPRSGHGYDYVLAGDGVWVQTENAHMRLRVPAASCHVRGLPEVGGMCELTHGRIPHDIWEEAVRLLEVPGQRRQEHPQRAYNSDEEAGVRRERSSYTGPIEAMVAVVWSGATYEVVCPSQDASVSHVTYEKSPGTVLELHSHHRMRAYFSQVDDADEQGLGLYGVVGKLHTDRPEVVLRAGAYGHFLTLPWEAVFEGDRGRFRDAVFGPPMVPGEPSPRVRTRRMSR